MIYELAKMCQDPNFDKNDALQLLKQVDIHREFSMMTEHGFSYTTTLQREAIDYYNIEMLSLLLEHGADPNQIYNKDESEFWSLQYGNYESAEKDEIRLKMAQLLLEYGANHLIDPDGMGECLLDYVVFAVFNDDGYDDLWKYRSRFLILLVAYGASTKYCTPRIVKEFDKSNMAQYEFYFVPAGNGRYSGVIVDRDGNKIAYL